MLEVAQRALSVGEVFQARPARGDRSLEDRSNLIYENAQPAGRDPPSPPHGGYPGKVERFADVDVAEAGDH